MCLNIFGIRRCIYAHEENVHPKSAQTDLSCLDKEGSGSNRMWVSLFASQARLAPAILFLMCRLDANDRG